MNNIIYTTFVLGLMLWQYSIIESCICSVKCRFILRHNLKKVSDNINYKEYGGMYGELEKLLIATNCIKKVKGPEVILYLCLLLGFGFGVATYFALGISMALICGSFLGLLPVIYLFLKLRKQRTEGSKEGDILLQEILANYKIYDCNMKVAIEETVKNVEEAPTSKTILLELLNGLNKAYTKEEIEKVLDIFKYSLGTVWGNALASNIYFAQVHGIKVTESLDDLCATLNKSKKVIEHSKQEHNEAKLMLKYLAPISYVLSVICACRYFGFTLKKFILYQFLTPLGLQWFLIMLLCYIVGLVINTLLSNEKMDIA